ncbi:Uncharacterised protein [Kluyvera cryocrescens]|uniref:Uncharacterized protein n=1 Tax=Kluyvera cryocrescens TaxID=580 RepID=A0A485C4H8_KLUCR|nr:Uncharacterised protein [Kluyvera cryocrescens]
MNSPVSQAAEFPASTQSVLREPAPLPASKKVWHNPMMVPLRPWRPVIAGFWASAFLCCFSRCGRW